MAMIIITMNPELIPAISGIYSKRVLLYTIVLIHYNKYLLMYGQDLFDLYWMTLST